MLTPVNDEPNAGQALAAGVAAADELGVRCAEPRLLRNGANVLVHLAPAPVVARVATATALVRHPVRDWMARDLAVAEHLVRAGIPAVPPSAETPTRPVRSGAHWVSFWTHLPHDPARRPVDGEFAALLADLHAALRDFPGALPDEPLGEIDSMLAVLGDGAWLDADTRADLRTDYARLRAELAAVDERQPLHGDAHPGNLLATPHGLVWNDFEDTWCGPTGWDLACLAGTWRMDGEAEVARYPGPAAALPLCRRLRALQAVLWSAVFNQHAGTDRAGIADQLRRWRAGTMAV